MILPIVAYGDPVLKKMGSEIEEDYPQLKDLISNMFETMYGAHGVGLAAPQIGRDIRLFIVDAEPFADDDDLSEEERDFLKNFKRVFINPIIIEEKGKEWSMEEGCLSIPDIRENVSRQPEVLIEYYDENWELKEEWLTGFAARVVQHEYDHIEGVLFTDKINPVKKSFLKKKLSRISRGEVRVNYRMRFPDVKR